MCFIHWGTLNNADNKKLKSVCSELKWCLIALCCQLRFNSRSFIVTIQQRAQLVGGYVSGKLFGMYFLCLQQLPLSLFLSNGTIQVDWWAFSIIVTRLSDMKRNAHRRLFDTKKNPFRSDANCVCVGREKFFKFYLK